MTLLQFVPRSDDVCLLAPERTSEYNGALLPSSCYFVPDSYYADFVNLKNKVFHVRKLADVLLPYDRIELDQEIQDLRNNDELTLSHLRSSALKHGLHYLVRTFSTRLCDVSFKVGDIGYISHNGSRLLEEERFNDFVKIGNVFTGSNPRDGYPDLPRMSAETDLCTKVDGYYREGWDKQTRLQPIIISQGII